MPGKKRINYARVKKDEYEDRLDKVIQMILDGSSNTTIVTVISKNFGTTVRQVYNYLQDAHKRLAEINFTNIYANYVRSLAIKQELLAKAMKDENYELALRISQSIDKLTGVEANALLISCNLDFSRLLLENAIKEFEIANESSDDKDERAKRFLLAMQNRIGEIFEQAFPFAFPTKQLEPGNDDNNNSEEQKQIESVL